MRHFPVIIVVMYLGFAFLLPLLGRKKTSFAGWCAVGVAAVGFVLATITAWTVARLGPYSYFPGGHGVSIGIEIAVDWIAVFMLITVNLLGFIILVYSLADLKREISEGLRPWFYSIFFLLLASLNGLAMAFDLFNIYVFTEIATIAACALVAIRPKRFCVEAALKYLILSALGSGMVLLGVGLIYMVTGQLNMGEIAQVLPGAFSLYPWNILVALSLFIVGFGIKAALFPLHVWLPDAHSSAPTPSSAILSGLVLKAFVLVIARIIFQVFGLDLFSRIPIPEAILFLSTLGIFAGSLLAIGQTDIKRMLAYSSVAQICYIFLGFALLSKNGIMGGLLHVFNHAVMKTLLFLAAGSIIYKAGTRKIEDLSGIGYRMPLTMTVFGIGALSMVGIPGFSGFISKYYLALAAMDSGMPFYLGVILLSSLLNAIYYFPIIIRAFFGQGKQSFSWDGLPWAMVLPLLVLAGINIFFGLMPGGLVRLVELAAGTWVN